MQMGKFDYLQAEAAAEELKQTDRIESNEM